MKSVIYDTGSIRESETGRGRFDLLPFEALERWALRMEEGARKYGDRNWEKGIPMSRTASSMIRHAVKWVHGCRDEDHLAAVMWNAACLIAHEERIRRGLLPSELADLPWQAIAYYRIEEC